MTHTPALASRRLQLTAAIDAARDSMGNYTVPPVFDEMLANRTITQEKYDEVTAIYRNVNASVEKSLNKAEANLQQSLNGTAVSVTLSPDASRAAVLENGSSSASGMDTASILGIVIGAVATLALMVGVFLVYKRRPRLQGDKRRALQTPRDDTLGSSEYSGMYRHKQNILDGVAWEDEALLAVRVPYDKVIKEQLISHGGFGEVYRGRFRDQVVAIKTLLPDKRKDVAMIKSFLAEIRFMVTLDHSRVVTFIGVAWDALSDLCVVTEFMNGGDLRTLLTQFEESATLRQRGFDADKVKIALHVAHALTYLHSLDPVVLHRDLKSRNILLDAEWNAKLTDFGISRERVDQTMTAGVGSSLWMAPEVMMGERYDEKADVFSFGVVLSELDTQQLPYANAVEPGTNRPIPQTAVLQLVSLGRLTISLSEGVRFREMQDLARECVSMDPRERPTAAEALHRVHVALRERERGNSGGLV